MIRTAPVETRLVRFTLQHLGRHYWLDATPAAGASAAFNIDGIRRRGFATEMELLQALQLAGIGHWSRFPSEGIEATVSRDQLRTMGFRGNF